MFRRIVSASTIIAAAASCLGALIVAGASCAAAPCPSPRLPPAMPFEPLRPTDDRAGTDIGQVAPDQPARTTQGWPEALRRWRSLRCRPTDPDRGPEVVRAV
jgi:hypothetical protein